MKFRSNRENDPLLLPSISNAKDRHTNPMLRQRNIQIQAMNSVDRATDDDDEAVIKESFQKIKKINFEEKSEDEHTDDSAFESYLVITFANNVPNKALHWIVDKIRGRRAHGGAELIVRMEPHTEYLFFCFSIK